MNLYVQDSRAWRELLSRKRFSDRVPAVKVVKRGIVLPARKLDDGWAGGVCDENFNFVAGFTRTDPLTKKHGERFACVCSSYAVDKKNITRLDEDVIFGGSLIGHFGHFMLECWTRLWYVIEHPECREKILFITTTHGGYHAWFDDFFRLMGIAEDRILYVKKPVQCRSVTVPEQAAYTPISFTKEFMLPYQTIKSNVKPSNHKKLYLTRTQFEAEDSIGVHCYNEKYFEDFFITHGFEAVSMEKLSVEKQISLIMGADEIAATLGTLTHWIMFCKPTVKFIMLNRVDKYVSGYQCMILEAFPLKNYYVVDASKNFMYANRTVGVVMLGSNRHWKEFVADYFGEHIEDDDDVLYFDEALDKYLKFWCRKYPYEDKPELWLHSLKNLCNRVVTLEQSLTKGRPLLCYQTYTGQSSSGAWKSENQPSGDLDGQLGIQGIRLDFTEPFHDVYYSVYCGGWSKEVSTAQIVGTPGKSITGLKIHLDEDGAKDFDISYRVHTFDGVWTPWAKNGEELLTSGLKINAVQIKLVAKQK